MDDLISRKSAIDTIKSVPEGCWKNIRYAQEIEKLPSVDPEREVVHCKDCEFWTKQHDSIQGRCDLMQMYPTGEWYCGNAQLKVKEEQNGKSN